MDDMLELQILNIYSNDIRLAGRGVCSPEAACCKYRHHLSAIVWLPTLNLYTFPFKKINSIYYNGTSIILHTPSMIYDMK